MNTQNTQNTAGASMRRPALHRGLLATTLTAGVLLAAGCAAPAEDGTAENTAPATAANTTDSPTSTEATSTPAGPTSTEATSTPASPTGAAATVAAVTVADPWAGPPRSR